jgi:hypothetical protein
MAASAIAGASEMIFMVDALGLSPKLNVPPMVTFRQAAVDAQYDRSSDLPVPTTWRRYRDRSADLYAVCPCSHAARNAVMASSRLAA